MWQIVEKEGVSYVEVTLEGGKVVFEPGRLHYMKGRLEYEEDTSRKRGFLGRMFDSLAGISVFEKTVRGTGKVVLGPPTLGMFHNLDVVRGQEYFVDADTYVARTENLKIEAKPVKNVLKNAVVGREGLLHYRVWNDSAEPGKICIYSDGPIESHEVRPGETFYVDGDFAIAWTKEVGFNVTLLGKSWLTWISGEGWVSKFTNASEESGYLLLSPLPTERMQLLKHIDASVAKEHRKTRSKISASPGKYGGTSEAKLVHDLLSSRPSGDDSVVGTVRVVP